MLNLCRVKILVPEVGRQDASVSRRQVTVTTPTPRRQVTLNIPSWDFERLLKTLEESKEQVADLKNNVEVKQDAQQRLGQEKNEVRQVCALELAITYGTNRGRLLETSSATRTDDDRGDKHDKDTIKLHVLDVV